MAPKQNLYKVLLKSAKTFCSSPFPPLLVLPVPAKMQNELC